ncbi:hypothetical protein KNP414_07618 [Paenibacillus mucilaginosus KNP414]|uniref:Uncharacterized protein n=1 Tax=Paenibacillus mucilaginosus (strain KNP414) TaxID=1036673 RepID=F8FCL7_PAEMK|nr:hypothetical protein KNP414_07618 [Paenibacillus mucilaginosus KNP414]
MHFLVDYFGNGWYHKDKDYVETWRLIFIPLIHTFYTS